MADHTQGHREPDEESGSFSLGSGAVPDDFVEEPLQNGLGELFVSDDSLDFDALDGFEGDEALLEDFDEQELEAFFDPEEPDAPEEEGLDQLRAELLDEDVLNAAEGGADRFEVGADELVAASADGYADDYEDEYEDEYEDHSEGEEVGAFDDPAEEVRVSSEDALGSLFSELGDAEREDEGGQDAWALDQVVEEGMSWLMELGEGESSGEASQGAGFEEDSDEDDWISSGASGSGGGGRRGLITVAVVALLGVGGYFGYQEYFPKPEAEPELAVRPRPPKPPSATPGGGAAPEVEAVARATEIGAPEAGPEAVPEDPQPGTETTEPPADPAAGGPNPEDPTLGPRPFAGPASDLRDPFLALSQAGDALPPSAGLPFTVAHFTSAVGLPMEDPGVGVQAGSDDPIQTEPEVVVVNVDPNPDRESRDQRLAPEDLLLLPDADLPYRMATADDLRGVWPGATIPVDRIEGPERLLTPSVGRVRVILNQGEVFDGRLYAVGEKKVWLEFAGGRMALISWQIDRIEHLASGAETPELGSAGSAGMKGLERVRVRTPGGVFYGKLLNQEGERVTLLTGDGARITLEHATVEPAGRSRTRIIDASGVDPDDPSHAQ